MPKGTSIYKTLIFVLNFPHYNHIYIKKNCKYFVLLMNVIMTIKMVFLTKPDGYQEICDKQKCD